MELETEYNKMLLTGNPSFLGETNDFLDKIESSAFCDVIYGDSNEVDARGATLAECKTVMNGIALQGLTAMLF